MLIIGLSEGKTAFSQTYSFLGFSDNLDNLRGIEMCKLRDSLVPQPVDHIC